jgi:RNA polymerase sigma factor (sigma-70 family)
MELGKVLTNRLAEKRAMLTREREVELSNIIQGENSEEKKQEAMNELVEANIGLAITIANQMHHKKHLSDGIDLCDFISEGFLGLIEAAKRYIGEKSKFSWYSSFWIRMKIYRFSENTMRNIRKPVSVIQKIRKLKKLEAAGDTEDEILLKMNLSSRDELKTIEIANNLHFEDSLDKTLGFQRHPNEYEAGTLHDKLAHAGIKSPDDELHLKEMKNILIYTVKSLPPREKFIIEKRFLGDIHTLQEIGDVLNLTKERVRQLEIKALCLIRSQIKENYGIEKQNG